MNLSNNRSKLLAEALMHSNWIESEYSLKAIRQSAEAFEFLYDNKILSTSIQECHKILMTNFLEKDCGTYRTCAVSIGGVLKPNIGQRKIRELMENWCKKYKNVKTKKQIIKAHIDFEEIHPFRDGNGRMGRIIMNIQALKNDLDPIVIKIGNEQYKYYEWFSKKSKKDKIDEILSSEKIQKLLGREIYEDKFQPIRGFRKNF